MARNRSRFPTTLVTSVGLVVLAAVVLVASLVVTDPPLQDTRETSPEVTEVPEMQPDPEPRPRPAPERPVQPAPPPPPEPVAGTSELVEVVDLSASGSGVFREGTEGNAPVPVEEEAVEAFVRDVTAWLDAHLMDVQRGGPGTIPELGGELLEPLDDSEPRVDDVTYAIRIGARGAPEWAEVTITVTGADEAATRVLAVVPGDEPTLVAASAPRLVEETGAGQQVAAASADRS